MTATSSSVIPWDAMAFTSATKGISLSRSFRPFAVRSTDYVRAFADQIRPWISAPYTVLGTDGFGRSDYRAALRRFFEVDRHHVAYAALIELVKLGELSATVLADAAERFEIDTDGEAPWLR